MSRVFYRTVLSLILIYNSETTWSILTKFLGDKRSDMENMLAKFCCPKMVAMETVSDCFSSMPNMSAGGQAITMKFWEFVPQEQSYNLCLEHIFLRITEFQL